MSLEEKLRQDLGDALKKGEKTRVSTLRLVLSRMNYLFIEKGSPLTEPDILGALAKEAEQRRESILAFRQGNRPELAAQEEAELQVLLSYLPQALTPQEVEAYARQVIAELGALGLKDKGKVMPRLIAELKGRAEGRLINEVVTRLLSSG